MLKGANSHISVSDCVVFFSITYLYIFGILQYYKTIGPRATSLFLSAVLNNKYTSLQNQCSEKNSS